jgi:hypothetical protein
LRARHRLDLFLARGRAGHQLQVPAEALGRIRDEHPVVDSGVQHGPERCVEDPNAAAAQRHPDLPRDAALGDLFDPTPLEQLRQEGLDVAFLEEPDLHATQRGQQVKPERRAVGLDGSRLQACGDERQPSLGILRDVMLVSTTGWTGWRDSRRRSASTSSADDRARQHGT